MHSHVYVLLPANTTDILGQTRLLLAPFDQNLELAPHKRHITENNVQFFKEKHGTNDLRVLAEKLQRDFHEEFGVDDLGLFEITTFNEMGKWDYWSLKNYFPIDSARVNRWGKDLAPSIVLVSDLNLNKENAPHSMLTPDGKWHDVDDFGYVTRLQFEKGLKGLHPANVEPMARWRSHVREVLNQHADHLVLAIDCHS
jgi:hypothetical protein